MTYISRMEKKKNNIDKLMKTYWTMCQDEGEEFARMWQH